MSEEDTLTPELLAKMTDDEIDLVAAEKARRAAAKPTHFCTNCGHRYTQAQLRDLDACPDCGEVTAKPLGDIKSSNQKVIK